MSHCAPGYRFQYQVPPKSPPFSTIRTSSTPASFSLAPVTRPAKPAPMNANVTWSRLGSRSTRSVYGSVSMSANVPVNSRY